MSVLDLFRRKKSIRDIIRVSAIDAASANEIMGTRNVKSISLGYSKNDLVRSAVFESPEYDLGEIAKAEDVESYLSISFDRHIQTVMRRGFFFSGDNPETVDYIEDRVAEFEWRTDRPFTDVIRDLVSNIVKYSNGFLVIKRDPQLSSGSAITLNGRVVQPISGIFAADATSMNPKADKNGNVINWMQEISLRGRSKVFSPLDVIHIPYRRKTGFVMGTPTVIPVLDDIRALRRIEEMVEMLISKHVFPLIHYRVGTETNPAQYFEDEGKSEVDIVSDTVESMPTEGFLVTPERHDVSAIEAGSSGVDARPYIDYYEKRVIAGLNISDIDLGRGSSQNRATANVLSRGLVSRAKDFQSVISDYLRLYLLDRLLIEGGFELNSKNRVSLEWPEIDEEQKRLRENHALALYQGHCLSEKEMRLEIGRKEIDNSQREDMFLERVQKVLAIIKAVDEQFLPQSNLTKNKEQPQNQNGKKLARTFPANDYMSSGENVLSDSCSRITSYISSMNGTGKASDLMDELNDARDKIKGLCVYFLHEGMKTGAIDAAKEKNNDSFQASLAVRDEVVKNYAFSDIDSIFSRIRQSVKSSYDNGRNPHDVVSAIRIYVPILNSHMKSHYSAARKFGYLNACKIMGDKTIETKNGQIELDMLESISIKLLNTLI